MGAFLLFLIHIGAVYIGVHAAQIEYADIWRSIVVALVSYIVMFFVALLLIPLAFVPFVNLFLGAIILGVGTSLAAKMVLSCDWKPAWIVGITATVVNMIFSWMLSGCA